MSTPSRSGRALIRAHLSARRNARLFSNLSGAESDSERASIYRRISENEAELADYWLGEIKDSALQPNRTWSPTVTLLTVGARLFPTRQFSKLLQRQHRRWLSTNHALLEGHEPRRRSAKTAQGLEQLVDARDAQSGHSEHGWLASRSGALRAGVLGVNDGLVSNFSLTMGIAGATSDPTLVLLAGLAGLLAGALSMAAGEYVSVKSQNEYCENLIEWERTELMLWPGEETQELAELYESKGLRPSEAEAVASRIMSDPDVALDTHVREELGIDPENLSGSPWAAAISSLVAFAGGSIVPVVPYMFGAANATAIGISAAASIVALATVGSSLGWMSGANVLKSGFRMVAIGSAAAIVTYLLGTLVGTQLN